ncbi:MAG: hypothetical protein EHM41_01395 [Chloroflexi bacterium]|nr:MAG: hypothetical protein EHM41_01395 [Chloroflexota bacterium]
MNYLIDGHNLIPQIPDLSLEAIDDEKDLIFLLQEFCRVRPKNKIHVYFDKAPAGMPLARSFGSVTAHFVRSNRTADEAIAAKIHKLGKEARNWTVVSSDRQVQTAAKSRGAIVLSSETFSNELINTIRPQPHKKQQHDIEISPEEVDEWLKIFRKKGE